MTVFHIMMAVLVQALMAAVVLQTASATRRHAEPEANTPLGKLRGHTMTSRGGRRFLAFSGVPYAKPPVGELTFQPPQPLEPWKGIKEAKENGPWCLQYNLYDLKPKPIGELDCLYLSLYTHKLDGRAPVLVHFHGGGFISGNGANMTGPQYLMDEDVVIVDVNYRVGIFGFLSFEDKDLPGNQGLKDQVMAIRWVQQNIASFGGDPNKVTLVGESAGAGGIYLHTISPLSKGLFHRAILESGSAYGLWCVAVKGSTRKLAMKLVKELGGNYTSTKEAVEFIRKQDPKEVASKLEKFKEWQIDPIFNFGPMLEEEGPGAFITVPVSKWKQLTPVPLLIGTTSAEGLLRAQYFLHFNTSFEWYSENFEKVAPFSLLYFASASDPDKITKEVRKFYFPNHEITENDWRNLTNMYGDSWTIIPAIDAANNYTGDVYFYYYDYVGEKSWSGDSSSRNNTIVFGATHNEELTYIWYSNYVKDFEGKDLEVSKKLVKIWTDFAKYGNPTPSGRVKWDKWTVDRNRYMYISKAGFAMKEGLLQDRYRFWKSINYRDNYD